MVITFVTPPGRPSVLRANTVHDARAQHADVSTMQERSRQPLTTALRHTNSEPTPASDDDQVLEHQPLIFQKRNLPHLTTSPESVVDSFDLPRSRKSLDDTSSHDIHSGEPKKVSLLSTAMVASSAQPPRSASTTNLGILRRAESESTRSSLDGVSRATGDASESTVTAPRPRLQFIEPHKQPHSHLAARHDATVPTSSSTDGDVVTATQTPASTSTATQSATEPEPAPRKRSLVIQEHADVIERAAERAARQANHLSSQALEQHTRTGGSDRARQHSASSAGEETASTRSSWALRSNSRGSSVGTSPSVVSEDNSQEPPELELSKLSEPPAVVPIFNNTTPNDRVDAKIRSAPANPLRKLTFISPAPSKRRRSPEANPVSSTSHQPGPDEPSSSSKNTATASNEQAPPDSSRRVLAFAACPKPPRATRLSPAHATRKPKSKLSASPAPHKLAYPQRLKGMRGSDPIRSPAPHNARVPSTTATNWEQLLEDVSSEGSGYSEDEEDGDTEEEEDDDDDEDDDDEDDDALSQSNASDKQSLSESSDKGEESASLSHGRASLSSDAIGKLREEAAERGKKANRSSSTIAQADRQANHLEVAALLNASLSASSQKTSSRRPSGTLADQHVGARATLAYQTSPPRASQPSHSRQTSPLSGLTGRSSRKLKPKDSFSHPMCFLPGAFEDSAPPTPTELDSDANESALRANLLPGWFSEGGGSAASSRRASWQQSPLPVSPRLRGEGDEGLAVPITLPPFRRARERTVQQGVMSDSEQSSRSLGGNAAFIRESAGLGRSPAFADERLDQGSAGASPRAAAGPQALGISVPVQGRPTQPVSWRHLSSQQVPMPDRSTAGAYAYRRASHSMEPRKYSSAVTSPIGSYSHTHVAARVPLHAAGAERPVRPSVGKQRAVSTSSHIRSRPSVAPSMHDAVVVATSPPRDDASAHLKHHLAHSPKSPAGYSDGQDRGSHASGSITPGWMSDGQLPSQTTSRYWTERLSSLAQAMSEELSLVSNAVLGKESKASADVVDEAARRRAHSVPLESAVLEGGGGIDEVPQQPQQPQQQQQQDVAGPPSAATWSRRSSVGVPVPSRKAHRDDQTQAMDADADADAEEGRPFQFAKRHTDTDGSTRLVVIHTSNASEVNVGKVEDEL